MYLIYEYNENLTVISSALFLYLYYSLSLGMFFLKSLQNTDGNEPANLGRTAE